MASPIPKDPAKRARSNKDIAPVRYIAPALTVERPELPEFSVLVTVDGETFAQPFEWPARTVEWWAMLDFHPLKNELFEADWEFLLDTARIHAAFWLGDLKLAGELRLREEKYGFTPKDRATLRIFTAAAVTGESNAVQAVERGMSARDRMRDIRPA